MAFLTTTLGTKAALALLVFIVVWLRLWQIERHGEEEQRAARETAECAKTHVARPPVGAAVRSLRS